MKKFTCLNASSSMYCTKNRVIPCNSIKKLDRRKSGMLIVLTSPGRRRRLKAKGNSKTREITWTNQICPSNLLL